MTSRTLKIVCAISILINIFLIGAAVGGAAWVRARHPVGGSLRVAGAELPPDQRRAFRQTLRAARQEMRPTMLAGRQARADAAALLRAPTLDRPAFDAALARIRAADIAIRAHVEDRAADYAAGLPQSARAELADGLERHRGRGKARATESGD